MVRVEAPVDVVLFEGWCVGFASIEPEAIKRRYAAAKSNGNAAGRSPYFLEHSIESLLDIDRRLQDYEKQWYTLFDTFIQLRPVASGQGSDPQDADASQAGLENVFRWRLQAEHAMKASNGGKGMTDEQVHKFVERYMPGYEIWGEEVTSEKRPWHGKGLRLDIGSEREVIRVTTF